MWKQLLFMQTVSFKSFQAKQSSDLNNTGSSAPQADFPYVAIE